MALSALLLCHASQTQSLESRFYLLFTILPFGMVGGKQNNSTTSWPLRSRDYVFDQQPESLIMRLTTLLMCQQQQWSLGPLYCDVVTWPLPKAPGRSSLLLLRGRSRRAPPLSFNRG